MGLSANRERYRYSPAIPGPARLAQLYPHRSSSPEGTVLTKPRARQCERSEQGRSPGLVAQRKSSSHNVAALRRHARMPSFHNVPITAVPSGLRATPTRYPGLRRRSPRSRRLALGFVTAVPSGRHIPGFDIRSSRSARGTYCMSLRPNDLVCGRIGLGHLLERSKGGSGSA